MGYQLLITILGSTAFSSVVATILNHLLNEKKRKKETDDAIQLLLYHDIKCECKEYISRGHIDHDEYEVLTKMHSEYHRRGGNGYLDKLMKAVNELPFTEEEAQ